MQSEQSPASVGPHTWSRSALVTGLFGAIWGVIGAQGFPAARNVCSIVFIAGGILIVARVRRQISLLRTRGLLSSNNPLKRPAYRYAMLFEAVTIPVVVFLLATAGHPEFIMPAVSAIVGLHFLGLVHAFQSRRYLWISLGMVGLSAGTVALIPAQLPGAGHQPPIQLWMIVTGWGCAAILWASSSQNLRRTSAFLKR